MDGLHLDHEPPLTDAERRVPAIVCNPQRVQLLCESDHAMKTRRQQGGTGFGWLDRATGGIESV